MPMPMWGYSAGFGWAGFLWMALNVLFWLAVVCVLAWALARWLIQQSVRTDAPSPPAASALDVLTPRLTRDEAGERTELRMHEQLEGPQPREPALVDQSR